MEFLETATGGKAVAHQNYLFKLKSSKHNYSWWACKLSTCTAKLTIRDYNLVIAEKGTHAHTNDCHEIKALQCLQQIKKRTLEDIMTPITTIYREETSKEIFPAEVNQLIPQFKKIRRQLYRIRQSVRPPLPQSVAEVRIDNQWSKTVDGRNFLISDSGTGDDRIIIFGTSENLRILCEADRIFMDGTFKIVPALFHQLYTIHAKYKGQVFPLMFVLLQSSRQFHYETMWRQIGQAAVNQGLNFDVKAAICDFETSAINAVHTIFPAAVIKGCYFHCSQSVMRKVQSIGLRGEYIRNEAVKKWIKKLSILPLVPPSLVGDAFILIQEEAPQDPRTQLLENYIVDTYLEDDIYHPCLFPNAMLNQLKQLLRITIKSEDVKLSHIFYIKILLFTCLTITVEIPTRSESPPSVVASFIARLTAFLEQIVYEAVPSMASIPVTSFSASKIHDHVRAKHKHDDFPSGEESQKIHRHNPFEIDKMLPKYNGKLMNSIWGQYNLYAAHAFQKNSEGSYGFVDPLNIPQVKNLWNSLRTTH